MTFSSSRWFGSCGLFLLLLFMDLSIRSTQAQSSVRKASDQAWQNIAPFFTVPKAWAQENGSYRSPLYFENGTPVQTAEQWKKRREEILQRCMK